MAIVMTAGLAWVLVGVPMAIVVGRSMRLADATAPVDPCESVEQFLREQAAAAKA